MSDHHQLSIPEFQTYKKVKEKRKKKEERKKVSTYILIIYGLPVVCTACHLITVASLNTHLIFSDALIVESKI